MQVLPIHLYEMSGENHPIACGAEEAEAWGLFDEKGVIIQLDDAPGTAIIPKTFSSVESAQRRADELNALKKWIVVQHPDGTILVYDTFSEEFFS